MEMVLRTGRDISPAEAPRMFNRIAQRYDLLNTVLSLGRDAAWRNRLAQYACVDGPVRVLDVAAGTGAVLRALMQRPDRPVLGIGLDNASQMLAIGRRKLARNGLNGSCTLVHGDAGRLPFQDESFDVLTIAFGIRNMPDVPGAVREMRRVLRHGGRLLALEFSLPANAWVRAVYLPYFRHILPRIGGFVSGDREAYRYLNHSVERFPYGEAFCRLLAGGGFGNVRAVPLTFGIATLYQGERP